MVRCSAALLNISLGTVTRGEGSWEALSDEAPPTPLPVLVVLPTLAGEGMGERLCVCVCVCVGFGVYKEKGEHIHNHNGVWAAVCYMYTNSGRQGSSLSFIMNCVFRPL